MGWVLSRHPLRVPAPRVGVHPHAACAGQHPPHPPHPKTPHRLLRLVPLGSHFQIQQTHGVMTFSVLMGSVEEWPMKLISSQETLTCSLSAPSPAFGQLFSLILSPSMSVCHYRACSHKPAHRAFMANWVLPLTRGKGRKEETS